jgi:hypothetical protein
MPLWATNTFAFGSLVKGLPRFNPGITYKDIYLFLVVNLFTYASHTKITTDHDGALFSVKAVVYKVYYSI